MRGNEVARMLGGSIAVYTIMAACSASSGPLTFNPGDGGGSGSSGGATGDGSGGILDALTDPVSSANADPNQSGTRLKLNYYSGSDGSKQSVGTMHDSMLNVDCGFSLASDGTLRCLPSPAAYSGGLFTDAACTQPLVEASKGCAAPAYAIIAVPGATCATQAGSNVFTMGAQFGGASAYEGNAQNCAAYPVGALADLENTFDIYTVGSELPPSTFVQATVQTE